MSRYIELKKRVCSGGKTIGHVGRNPNGWLEDTDGHHETLDQNRNDRPYGASVLREARSQHVAARKGHLMRAPSSPITPFSQLRAQEIWEQRRIQNVVSHAITPGEDAYVRQIWEKLPGHCSWMSAFFCILNGKLP